MPGRMTAVHCMDLPKGNTGKGDGLHDFPGDIIRLHEANGWEYAHRYHVWKEPLGVRNRTMKKGLAHQTIVNDSDRIWCLGKHDDTYLVYALRGGQISLDLANANGLFASRWFDPRSGEMSSSRSVSGGGVRTFDTPSNQDWVLWLSREREPGIRRRPTE